jgi:hypothetical protein
VSEPVAGSTYSEWMIFGVALFVQGHMSSIRSISRRGFYCSSSSYDMGGAALAFVNISLLHKLVCAAFCAKVKRMIFETVWRQFLNFVKTGAINTFFFEWNNQ